jgi:hypothetical protein
MSKGSRNRDKARVRALLAELGQSMHPEATVSYVERPKGPASLVVLDLVSDYPKGVLPEYCTHGYAECIVCYGLCFLGHKTSEVVTSGKALPICKGCAVKSIPPDTEPIERFEDHLRKDGPH